MKKNNIMKRWMIPWSLVGVVFACSACSSDTGSSSLPELGEQPEYVPGKIIYTDAQSVKVEMATVSPADGTTVPAENMLDENVNTICRSKSLPADFDFFFDGTSDLDYLVYTPRIGANGSFGEVEIWVKTEETGELVLLKTDDWRQPTEAFQVDFAETLGLLRQLRIRVKTARGNGKAICADLDFYRKGSMAFNPYTIFADEACTQLKEGVTEEQINSIDDLFWKNLATFIYHDWYHPKFRIQTYQSSPDPRGLKDKYYISPYSLYVNPTGMYTEAGDTLVVLAEGIPVGQQVGLVVRDYKVGLKAGGIGSEKQYILKNGLNIVRPQNKGLTYVQYWAEAGELPAVKLHFASGQENGVYRLDSMEHQKFKFMLSKAPSGFMDLIGKYAHATFPVKDLLAYDRGNIADLVQVYDDIVRWEQEFMGVKGEIPNKLFFMYDATATNPNGGAYRTAYPSSSMSTCCDVDVIKSDSWLLGHEAGHVNQLSPGFKWPGMTEVSNNVMSLYVQKMLGVWPRKLEVKNVYSRAFAQMEEGLPLPMIGGTLSEEEDNVFSTGDPFVKLVPFWQLYLYCTEVRGKEDFYGHVYREIRNINNQWPSFAYGSEDGRYYGQMQLKFVEICCLAAEEDLTDFFEAWGFLQPFENEKVALGNKSIYCDDYGKKPFWITQTMVDETMQKIKKMNLPYAKQGIQYLTDSTVDEYK